MHGQTIDSARRALFALALLACCCAGNASAGVAASIEGGHGEEVDIAGLGIAWTDAYRWNSIWNTELNLWVLGRVDQWHGKEENPVVSRLWDISATPILRLQPRQPKPWFPFFDVGVGVHWITATRINAQRQFSTRFQFGEFFGPGLQFGPRAQYEIAFRVQHVSNGNIKEPNNGLSVRMLVLQYHF